MPARHRRPMSDALEHLDQRTIDERREEATGRMRIAAAAAPLAGAAR